MGRDRIVIDLDAAQHATGNAARKPRSAERQRGLWRPLLVIAIVFLVVIMGAAGGAYFWWRHYQSGPAYTLAVLADASQRNDAATIDSIFDTEKITDDFVSQVRQRSASSYSSAITSALPVQIVPSPTSITPNLKQTVHDEMVKELQRLTAPASGKPFVLVALAVPHFVDIIEEDNTAHALVNIKDEQLRLTMESGAGRWRITSIQDDKLAKRIADGIVRDMPLPGTQLQEGIRKQLNKVQTRAQ